MTAEAPRPRVDRGLLGGSGGSGPPAVDSPPAGSHRHELAVGPVVEAWSGARAPDGPALTGRFCRVGPLEVAHAPALWAAFGDDPHVWRYLGIGPYAGEAAFTGWVADFAASGDPLGLTITAAGGRPIGVCAYLRIAPAAGTIEVGHIIYGAALRRSVAATEAMYLLMHHVFDDLGYRRYEWKCNALNEASKRAARRLGFTLEGVWRQADVVKGRNRDTAWFAMTDADWQLLRPAYQGWLDDGNFDAGGQQRVSLSALTRDVLRDARDAAVLSADSAFFAGLFGGDAAALDEVLAEDFVLVDIGGHPPIGRADVLAAIGAGALSFDSVDRDPAATRVRHYGGTALVSGRTRLRFTVDGAPFEVASRYVHVYVGDGAGWRLASAQGTPVTAG